MENILKEKINNYSTKYKLEETKYGYFSIQNMPSEKELSEFYTNKYFNNEEKTSHRGMDIGSREKKERFHFDRKYKEIVKFLENSFENESEINILDAGCGKGVLLEYLLEHGYNNLYGTEYDSSLNNNLIDVFNGSFLNFETEKKFDFISFNNVLEHVVEPEKFLDRAHTLMSNKSYLRISVPNDMSPIQEKIYNDEKYERCGFFAPPAHLHYFSFDSMEKILRSRGFEPVYRTTDWSMEMFLLMGLDYINDPKLGKLCHNYRINFEYSMGEKFLSTFYRKMAEIGFGRNVIIYAKKVN